MRPRSTSIANLEKEVARLTRERDEALQQQRATADVLKVISRSTFDLHTVLGALTKSAAQLCAADRGVIFQRDGEVLPLVANYGFSREAEEYWVEHPAAVDRGSASGRALLEGRPVHLPDVLADPEYRATRYQEQAGYRTVLAVPLLRSGTPIGVLALSCDEVNPFTEKQIELVTTFADQAVIAIENARLLNELRESLEQQTATSDVLRVISSSPTDIQPVLETISERAEKLCDAEISGVWIVDGELIRLASAHGLSEAGMEAIRRASPQQRTDETVTARAIRTRNVCHVADVLSDPQYHLVARKSA